MMTCGFCNGALHVVEEFIYHEGQVFHPQTPGETYIRCSPRLRQFEGDAPGQETCYALQLVPRSNPGRSAEQQ
jgi:hypothetical protein